MTVGKLIKYLIISLIFILLVFNYFVYFDIENDCFIKISLSLEVSNSNIKKAMKALKFASPEDYQTICTHVDTINSNVSCGGFGGGCFNPRKPKAIYVSTSRRSLGWAAAVIVHETCHVIQGQEGRPFSEEECSKKHEETLKRIVEF